uniref:Ig-like domain-containing protein n=1 Tax=Oryzias latipes TaxID=8090 RepID=A0A3P9L2J1_ORYLA
KEESTLEGTSVTLSYKYKNAAIGNEYFFWYRQFPGKPPEFLISHSGTGTPISQTIPGFSFKVSDDQRQMDLQISSAAVTDSAVYYCAVRPTVTGNNKTLYKNLQQPTTSTNTTSTRGYTISPDQDQLTGTEGKSVTMKCNYQTADSAPLLFWYKHDSDLQAPQFILWKGAKRNTGEHIPNIRYESGTTYTSTELTIRELTLADTALYYCAVDTQ